MLPSESTRNVPSVPPEVLELEDELELLLELDEELELLLEELDEELLELDEELELLLELPPPQSSPLSVKSVTSSAGGLELLAWMPNEAVPPLGAS
jgi:hypothetical protein